MGGARQTTESGMLPPQLHLRSSSVPAGDPEAQYSLSHLPRNQTLAREAEGCRHVLFHCSVFIIVDICRQVAGYGMKYYNDDQFPIEPTEVVAISEFLKVVIFIWKLLIENSFSSLHISFLYFVPSLLYAVNSNLYFIAMHYTTPPFWNILLQLRVVFTALMYRVMFRRAISRIQWSALGVLMAAIVLSKFSSAHDLLGQQNLPAAVVLSVVASVIASIGPLYTEYLFKNDKRSFTDMQLQLYFFGTLCTWGLYCLEVTYSGDSHIHKFISGTKRDLVMTLTVTCIVMTTFIGISTAYIMKRLDNMVKLYAESLSSLLMSLACVVFFPKRFTVDVFFVVSLALTFASIFMYEKDNLAWTAASAAAASAHEHPSGSNGGGSSASRVSTKRVFIGLIAGLAVVVSASVVILKWTSLFYVAAVESNNPLPLNASN